MIFSSLHKASIHSLLLATISITITPETVVAGAIQSIDELPYDENGRLTKHFVAVPERCAPSIQILYDEGFTMYGRDFISVEGEASNAIFPGWSPPPTDVPTDVPLDCPVACIERGVERSVAAKTMPQFHLEARSEGRSLQEYKDWVFSACQRVEQGFVNYLDFIVNMYWIDSRDGNRVDKGQLKQGERNTLFITSYLGHKFEFTNPETDEVVFSHTVEYTGIAPLGKPDSPIKDELDTDYEDQISSTLDAEWRRHKRVTRSFSPLGFHKGRLPDDLWASIQAYYYNNKNDKVLEEWTRSGKGFFVNWWEIDPFFVQIPWELRREWQSRLRELVEGWVGEELENTDIYGMRQYEGGARLLTHVDREQTHAASLIINVAQGNVSRPWTIEVHDHADRLHEVVMEPGDIVYYESAKCLHGRNTPLKGGFYTNLFAHYRPKGDAQWFTRENPPGTPEPLIDVGECRLVGKSDQYSQGAVKCDNDAIGPHLSPSMFTATSGRDLFKWWKGVSDGPPSSSFNDEL